MNWSFESRAFIPVAFTAALVLLIAPTLIPWPVQLALLALGVVVLGLPHGALDPATAEHAKLVHSRSSLVVFNALYTLVALAVIGLWWLFPVFTLGLFLAVSAWHFSGDWRYVLPIWAQWIGGAGLLMMPIVSHTPAVAEIFTILSGPGGGQLAEFLGQAGLAVPALMLAVAVYAAARGAWVSALEFAGLVALGWVAPPLVFFIVYFCLLHSPRHLREHFDASAPSEHPKLWRMLVIYTLATLLLAIPLLWLWSGGQLGEATLRLVFIGLAAVTVPHMLLMLYAESKTRSTQC
ncbi:MAG: Brp/Blh family beta-carotene 15,15'-dioxygenase [Wenzhouxiangella sp.]|jgi:Brp/Blh family beta-carotene 15,15'-monooxygenase|nr:Brp/Blh family beta-carotene 15,15'-dioxygenase [Wenzhouxiangella sp.]MDR9453028.1 Brp/Blh family beta-carotene 15,15'-dioxygenase [Wenzhouxiangella sp.]